MSTPSLVLWLQLEPLAAVAGVAAGLATFIAARWRPSPGEREFGTVGWQLLAMAAAAPAFFLGAELGLWLGLMGFRAPLALTGLARGLGWLALALAPIPIVAAWVMRRRPRRWQRGAATALLVAGAALAIAGPRLRGAAWRARAAAAVASPAALDNALTLEAHRYASPAEREALLDAAVPDGAAARAVADRARDRGAPVLSAGSRASLARRLLTALAADGAAAGDGVAATVWWLTGDPAATFTAHALATPALRPRLGAAATAPAALVEPRLPSAFQVIAADGLAHGDAATRAAFAEATFLAAAPVLLEPELIAALAERLGDPDPVRRLAWDTLLRNASTASLRPLLPTYTDPAAPQWLWLRSLCPTRTPDLAALQSDADPRVADGATRLFAYVRLNCKAEYRVR